MKSLSNFARFLHHRTQSLKQGEPVALPIYASSTFHLAGDPDGAHFYSRNGNPTVEAVEAAIGLIENAECVLFPSGMAAIAGSSAGMSYRRLTASVMWVRTACWIGRIMDQVHP